MKNMNGTIIYITEKQDKEVDIPSSHYQKSWYGKAKAIEKINGDIELKSYNTIVGRIHNGIFERLWSGYSATTMRHVNAFLDYYGLDGGGKKWWDSLKVYG